MKVLSILVLGTSLAISPPGAQGVRPLIVTPEKPQTEATQVDQKTLEGRTPQGVSAEACGLFLWTEPDRRWLDSSKTAKATADRLKDCLTLDKEAAPTAN
jgi:hypothetical protein